MADEPIPHPRETTRDFETLRRDLTAWLARQLGPGTQPQVTDLVVPEANGMSSETVLFDVSYLEDGSPRQLECVARLEPEVSAMPVFPTYDFALQAEAMRLVGRSTTAPVPDVHWFEPDSAALGSPFLVMQRIVGEIPPDVMPYTFGSWLSEASTVQQRHLQDSTVEVLAEIHTLTPDRFDVSFLGGRSTGESALRDHVESTRAFHEWAAQGRARPLIDRTFAWLDAHWPDVESPAALSWGDSRIGNVLYRDFTPVGVLDWEMAALAPPEVDVAWLVFMHRFFQDITEQAAMVGMPDFLRLDDVVGVYEQRTGAALHDLEWHVTYAALRHATIMSRVQERMAQVAGTPLPDDPDDLIMHRATLEGLLAGTYQSKL